MTIDEQLAYIRTLQQSHDEQIGKLVDHMDALTERMDALTERMDAGNARMDVLTERTIQAMEAINRLARIADIHEDRISGLEEQ